MKLEVAKELVGLLVQLTMLQEGFLSSDGWTENHTKKLATYSLADWVVANSVVTEHQANSDFGGERQITFGDDRKIAELYLRTVNGSLVTDDDIINMAEHAPDILDPDELYCVTLDYDGEVSLCTVGHDGMPNERVRTESTPVDLYNWLSNKAESRDGEYVHDVA